MAGVKAAKQILDELSEIVSSSSAENKEIYKIGDLAREFGVSLRTLRFYEDRGLLTPKRSGSTRLYSTEDRKRFRVILLVKSLGFSLLDIQELLDVYDQDPSNDGVSKVSEKFEKQLGVLYQEKRETEQAISNLQNAIQHILAIH